MLEPGKAAKSDKSSIITDAIRIVTQLRAENGQLRQLNKFLEVWGLALFPPAHAWWPVPRCPTCYPELARNICTPCPDVGV